ncbi:MAG TPA: alkaline phosphatase D family protein, partial [Polyangia bacterium]
MADSPSPRAPELAAAVAVGSVDHRSVRIWARVPTESESPLAFVLFPPEGPKVQAHVSRRPDASADHTLVFTYPDDFASVPDLRPSTRYRFRLQTDAETLIGEGGFDTAPTGLADTPDRFCFAFSSCHQPFSKDGTPGDESLAMLAAADRALAEHGAKFLLMLGDQVYSDEPAVYSVHGDVHLDDKLKSALLSASPEEIRAAYHRQYRRSWAVPGFMRLQSQRVTYCVPDDHEIVDNWGSAPEHATPEWQKVGAGALQAYFDYQGSRSWPPGTKPPTNLARSFSYGSIAIFLMDVRSERRGTEGQEQVLSEAQVEALERFLKTHRDRHAVFIAVGVPIVHIPGWLNRMGEKITPKGNDLHDRWSHPPLIPQRDRILSMLAEHRKA